MIEQHAPSLRDQAIDAVAQALNTGRYWLPAAGQAAAVDAVLALVNAEACCVCGRGPVTYRNYREQPFCQTCADGEQHVCKPGANLYYCPTSGRTESDCHGGFDVCCDRPDLHIPSAEAAPTIAALQAAARKKGVRLALTIDDKPETGDTLAAAELEASQRRAVTFQIRIDSARAWARQNLDAEQQAGLLGVLRGDQMAEQSVFRPAHEDGTPYRYHEIVAEGWDHCDGCRTWIRGYTESNPHPCGPRRPAGSKETPDA